MRIVSALVAIFFSFMLLSAPVGAQAMTPCELRGDSALCQNTGPTSVRSVVKSVIEIALYIVIVAAVIMIIFAGIRYTTSGGNQQAVTSAKNMLVYSVVGLIVAIFAYIIVEFVYNQFFKGP